MGIVVIMLFIFLLIVIVLSLLDISKNIKAKRFSYKSLLVSPFITLAIYLALIVYWKSIDRVYVFEPFFLTSLFCIVAPFILSRIMDNSKKAKIDFLSNSLKASVLIGLLILIVFNSFIYDITKLIGVTVYN
jgi:hypothetical protein